MLLAQDGSGLLDCLIALTIMSIGSLGVAEMSIHRQQLLRAANQHALTLEAAWNTAVLLSSAGESSGDAITPADGGFTIARHTDNGHNSVLVQRALQNNRIISVSMPVHSLNPLSQ